MSQFWPQRPPRILTGTATGITGTAYTSVSFPAGFFTSPPMVACVSFNAFAATHPYISGPPTTSGFQVAINNSNPGTVLWIAVQT